MFSILTLTAMILQQFSGLPTTAQLTPEQERTIRVTISDYPAGTFTEFVPLPELGGALLPFTRVDMPKELKAAYAKAPSAVLGLLLRIADGGNPRESSSAAAYAFTLLDPKTETGGVVVIDMFKKATYDVVDEYWETTPRYHWIGKIKEAVKAKK